MKSKITLKNIKSYIQGNWRAVLLEYYPEGISKHIEEQYFWRIEQVKEKSPECLENKECKKCHCEIPELFLADKACENNPPCYPEMMSESEWNQFKYYNSILTSGPIIIRDLNKEETLADLMQNNPNLTKEELLYWCPEFKED